MDSASVMAMQQQPQPAPAAQQQQQQQLPNGRLERVHSHRTPQQQPQQQQQAQAQQPSQQQQPRNHGRQHSRHNPPELKTQGECALHHLFNSFVGQADQKIHQCVGQAHEPEQIVEEICGLGVDPKFDQLIVALGHIARQKPKPLIDTLMLWRKGKSEAATSARAEANQYRVNLPINGAIPRRTTGHLHVASDPVNSGINMAEAASPTAIASRNDAVVLAERRSTVSIYLLCRVLMEIIRQSTLACVSPEMVDRLEDIIFGQLKLADIENLLASPFRMANWKIFGELLSVMSELSFRSVTERFFKELDRLQREYSAKSSANKDFLDSKMELVIMGMRHFRFKTSPEDAFEQTCDFMHQLGRCFVSSHGQRTKHAFCRIIERFLLPIAAHAGPELNSPKWRAFIDLISPKVSQMLLKPRHWLEAFPVAVGLCCVLPPEVFAQQWMQIINTLQPKLKDRVTRPTALQAVSRLVWVYLYRNPEPSAYSIRKLEEVIRAVLPSGRRSYLATEPSIAEPLIQIIRFIGYKQQDLCFRSVIFPLINSEAFAPGRDQRVDQLEPEKMVIGIRAFLSIMADLEKGSLGRPPFPLDFGYASVAERIQTSCLVLAPHLLIEPIAPIPREERISRPVLTSALGETAREYYAKFCEILGKITIICDDAFGGQAALDEKFSAQTPKTPIAETFNFSRRDEHPSVVEQKRGFYDLFHVAVQALPRSLSPDIPFNSLVNLLCTGTAHVNSNIAASSAESLRAIARQSHAQQVTIGFARFILNFDDRYSTMSDGGMLGPVHIENTLQLYVELLHIWIDEIKQKTKGASRDVTEDNISGVRGAQLDLSGIWAHVDEVESHGLFFLCSQSRRVRFYAITVLRLIKEFDLALGKASARIIHILERDSSTVMDFNDESLSVAERSRLQRGRRKSDAQSALIELCGSEVSYDSTLWFKIFPNLVRIAFDRCPFATALARDIVCTRLLQMHRAIAAIADSPKGSQAADGQGSRTIPKATTPPEVMVEQWKLYLIFACTTLTNAGAQSTQLLQDFQHVRKHSKPSPQGAERISSARSLFQSVIPLLAASSSAVRDAVVAALGSINVNLYRTLLESLQSVVAMCNDEGKTRLHQRTVSSPRRNQKTDILRTEITHVYKLTSHFLREDAIYTDDSILENLVTYTNALKIFLSDAEVQNDWEFQKLRRHYCGLVEELFEGINRTQDPARWMPFEARKSSFALMEDWCGFSPTKAQARREDSMRQSVIEQQRDFGDKATAAMEIEKRNLRTAALSAMAALCAGPVSVRTEKKVNLSFDLRRMLQWIETIFSTPSDKLHAIGHRALKNLIIHNRAYPVLLERAVHMCYVAESKALQSYFEVISEVLIEHPDYPLAFWRILGPALFILGHEKSHIRSKSARLLRTLEERMQKSSKIQDFDIGIADKTTAVYKLAQFEISKRLAKQHSEHAFLIFSEFTYFFKNLDANKQRNMVAALLPWVQIVDLQIDPNGGPTANSYMLLSNLFEITVSSGVSLHNEVQALWQALATGPHAGNVQVVLDFIISLCLERREQNFVDFAKQIVVFLSSTPAGQKVVEFLMLQITPKAMVQELRDPAPPPPETSSLPYLADLSLALPVGNKQAGFSLGQLCLILLVDLMVSPVELAPERVPVLLQIVFVLWDHYIPMVQDQAREMLVHLIHELVISKIDEGSTAETEAVQSVIDAVRQNDASVTWAYGDCNKPGNRPGNSTENREPKSMEALSAKVIDVFSLAYPGIREQWGKTTLCWATSCPVRHIACRSFQLFRCILTSLDQSMLADMLARLSNTIADDESDIQSFSMELLTTLKTIIRDLSAADLLQYPQLFWTTCACLNTVHESEFLESIAMLESFVEKVDLGRPEIVKLLVDSIPSRWEGSFEGVQQMVYPGVRSSLSLNRSLTLLDKLVPLPNNYLVGDDSRLLFTVLANLPGLMHAMTLEAKDPDYILRAENLAKVAELQGCSPIRQALMAYVKGSFRAPNDFLAAAVSAIRETFLPAWDLPCLVFLMGMLNNQLGWFKIRTMQMLCAIIPAIDMRKPDIARHGSDLISPLLRLLQTEFCPQALEVLDHVMTMPGTPKDQRHIRMSMAGSKSRKEFERTESLFGIPDDSGWSIPMPAVHKANTRGNVHAVFYTCAGTENGRAGSSASGGVNGGGSVGVGVGVGSGSGIGGVGSTGNSGGSAAATLTREQLEFHIDDFHFGYPYSQRDRAATMLSDDVMRSDVGSSGSGSGGVGHGGGGMGELVRKLNSLDDFFEDAAVNSPMSTTTTPLGIGVGVGIGIGGGLGGIGGIGGIGGTGGGDPRTPPGLNLFPVGEAAAAADAGARYEQQTLPLLHKSLTRTASVSSLQNGFSDARTLTMTTTAARDLGVMSPTAFAAPPPPPSSSSTAHSTAGGHTAATPPTATASAPSSATAGIGAATAAASLVRPSLQPRMMTTPPSQTFGSPPSAGSDVFSDHIYPHQHPHQNHHHHHHHHRGGGGGAKRAMPEHRGW